MTTFSEETKQQQRHVKNRSRNGVKSVGFDNKTMIKIVAIEQIDILLNECRLNIMDLFDDLRVK
jgi:uncharacterized protein (UPF0335 family)